MSARESTEEEIMPLLCAIIPPTISTAKAGSGAIWERVGEAGKELSTGMSLRPILKNEQDWIFNSNWECLKPKHLENQAIWPRFHYRKPALSPYLNWGKVQLKYSINWLIRHSSELEKALPFLLPQLKKSVMTSKCLLVPSPNQATTMTICLKTKVLAKVSSWV